MYLWCIYLCVYVCVCVCVCTNIQHVNIWLYIHVCMCVYTRVLHIRWHSIVYVCECSMASVLARRSGRRLGSSHTSSGHTYRRLARMARGCECLNLAAAWGFPASIVHCKAARSHLLTKMRWLVRPRHVLSPSPPSLRFPWESAAAWVHIHVYIRVYIHTYTATHCNTL